MCLNQNQVQGTVYVNTQSALCLKVVNKVVNKLFSIRDNVFSQMVFRR